MIIKVIRESDYALGYIGCYFTCKNSNECVSYICDKTKFFESNCAIELIKCRREVTLKMQLKK